MEIPRFGPQNATSSNRHQIHPKIGHFTWWMGAEIAGLDNPGPGIGGVAFIAEVHAIHIQKCMQNIKKKKNYNTLLHTTHIRTIHTCMRTYTHTNEDTRIFTYNASRACTLILMYTIEIGIEIGIEN